MASVCSRSSRRRAFGNDDHGGANEVFVEAVAWLYVVKNDACGMFRRFHVLNRFVDRWIEGLSHGIDAMDAHLFQGI